MELQIHLDQFDGPLDLLLQMIRKAKIRIEDIFVTNIIDQYLEWMPLVDGKMEHASEFLETAALLLEIKSQHLLPKEPAAEDESELTPEQLLVRRLEEYARIKEASEMMREIEEEFYRSKGWTEVLRLTLQFVV
jgi:segregation and condensation protein A